MSVDKVNAREGGRHGLCGVFNQWARNVLKIKIRDAIKVKLYKLCLYILLFVIREILFPLEGDVHEQIFNSLLFEIYLLLVYRF